MIAATALAKRAAQGSMRTRLQNATADIHEATHSYPGFARLMSGTLDLVEYSALLKRLYGFYLPLERALRHTTVQLKSLDLKLREKAHLLYADLIDIGVSPEEIAAVPLCASLSSIQSQEDVIGCLYVIEGAGLGGSIMARRLDYLLGSESTAGRTFLFGRPSPDPLPWASYCQLLESYADSGNPDEIIEAARRTFGAFGVWLNRDYDHA